MVLLSPLTRHPARGCGQQTNQLNLEGLETPDRQTVRREMRETRRDTEKRRETEREK